MAECGRACHPGIEEGCRSIRLPGLRVLRNYGTTPSSWNPISVLILPPHILNSMGKFQKRSCLVKPQISLRLLCSGGISGSSTTTRYRGTPEHKETLGRWLVTEFRQPLQVQSHLEMPRILVQLGHTQRTWKLAPQTDPKWSPTWSLTRFQPICPLSARDGRYACQVSRAHRTHSRL